MKRWRLFSLLALVVGTYLAALFWSGYTFVSYARRDEALQVERPEPIQAALGDAVELQLRGAGFDRDMRLSLFMDAANTDALVGSFPLDGVVHDMQRDGHSLLVASDGGGLQVLDISDPLRPKLVRSLLRNTPILDIEQAGSRLFLACGKQGLLILERGDKHRFKQLASVYWPATFLESKVWHGYLYVATDNGLLVYDLNSALEDTPAAQINLGSLVTGIHFYQDFAYVQTSSGAAIYDITNPRSPHFVGTLPALKRIRDIAIRDDILYATDAAGVLSSYSLSDPVRPHPLDSIALPSAPSKIRIFADRLLVENGRDDLIVLDINKLASPEGYGYIGLESPMALAAVDNLLYIATFDKGLEIIDQNAILSRQLATTIPTVGKANDLLVADNRLFVADSKQGVLIRDLKTGAEIWPSISGSTAKSIKKSGQYLYLAQGAAGWATLDLSNPDLPVEIAHFPGMPAISLDVENDHLVFVSGEKLTLADISDRKNPILLDEVKLDAADVVISAGIIYVASRQQGVQLYRITVEGKLAHLGGVAPPWPMSQFATALKLDLVGDVAYLANGQAGLQLIDVQNPRHPHIISSIDLPGFTYGVKVAGDRVYAISRFSGLQVLDVSNPKQPALLVNISLHGLSQGVQPAAGMLYLANGRKGVAVIPVPQSLASIEYLSDQQLLLQLPSPSIAGRYSLQVSSRREMQTLNGVVTYR